MAPIAEWQFLHFDRDAQMSVTPVPREVRIETLMQLDAHGVARFVSVPGADPNRSMVPASAQVLLTPNLVVALEAGMEARIMRHDGVALHLECDDRGHLTYDVLPAKQPATPRSQPSLSI